MPRRRQRLGVAVQVQMEEGKTRKRERLPSGKCQLEEEKRDNTPVPEGVAEVVLEAVGVGVRKILSRSSRLLPWPIEQEANRVLCGIIALANGVNDVSLGEVVIVTNDFIDLGLTRSKHLLCHSERRSSEG